MATNCIKLSSNLRNISAEEEPRKSLNTTSLSISISDRTDDPFCRICLSSDNPKDLFSPCHCKGSLLHVHRGCLSRWIATVNPYRLRDSKVSQNSLRCQSCHFEYEWDISKTGRFVTDNAGYFATIAVFVVFFSTGVVWHTLDAIHQWFAEGQYEELANEVSLLSLRNVSAALYTPSNGLFADSLWEPANRTFIAARFHESGLGTSNPALASLVEPLVSTLAVAASFVLEGWMLAILFRRTDAFAFKPFFIALHIIAYLTTGALYPFHVFRFLNEAAFTAIDVMATWSSYSMASMYGSGCTFISFLHEVIDSDKGQGNWMDAVMITAVHFSAVSRSEQMSSVCSTTPVTVTAIVTILSALLKVLTSFYMCLLECYYGLMMLASMYDAFVDVWRITRHGMLRRFEGEIVENIAHVDS
ncbi:E3 ubiquitin-protein ligase MARCHF3 [Chytriomyces hyalinus]|nr:E3 ubiquitin-protein ligase MARCHF3 [Chytriomyces hyalinus]